ncbi:pantoate--beta-alanine ligase [Geosmithia morbida]|uniref:Pantoate--beta-alanine ligase n=1 Tax=Geosmithia morbida TaxID=1094350 RepID=A0A9P4Z0H0_9HYPO|nr:pantoate--beta-alanine ligase [Geosmithia morbida]KAF4125425.1 pantoate--beta-alanine ligase [Geosmithia morbida]
MLPSISRTMPPGSRLSRSLQLRQLRTATRRETLPSSAIRIFRSVDSVRSWRAPLTETRRTVGLVPTMGALHAGHLALIRAAARENHHVVVSVYVNPAQFGRTEDLESYPSTWEADGRILAALDRELAGDGANLGRITAVFAPTTRDMYPGGFPGQDVDSKGSFVTVTPVGEVLEGASRPTFFRGVATVCMKLFNIVQPTRVYFGQKDAQQTVVIRRMLADFMVPSDMVVCPTERDASDGLALSSRNVYLGPRRRAVAPVLHRALLAGADVYAHGEGRPDRPSILAAANRVLDDVAAAQNALPPSRRALFEVDYVSLTDPDTMLEIDAVDPEVGAILSGAIRMPKLDEVNPGEDPGHSGGPSVRLIDNVVLPPRRDD